MILYRSTVATFSFCVLVAIANDACAQQGTPVRNSKEASVPAKTDSADESAPAYDQFEKLLCKKWYAAWKLAYLQPDGTSKELDPATKKQAHREMLAGFMDACKVPLPDLALQIINETPREFLPKNILSYYATSLIQAGRSDDAIALLETPLENLKVMWISERNAFMVTVVRSLASKGQIDQARKIADSFKVAVPYRTNGRVTTDEARRIEMYRAIALAMSEVDVDSVIELAKQRLPEKELHQILRTRIYTATLANDHEIAIRITSMFDGNSGLLPLLSSVEQLRRRSDAKTETARKLLQFALSKDREYSLRQIAQGSLLYEPSNTGPIRTIAVETWLSSLHEDEIQKLTPLTQVRVMVALRDLKYFDETLEIENSLFGQSFAEWYEAASGNDREAIRQTALRFYLLMPKAVGTLYESGQSQRAEGIIANLAFDEGRMFCAAKIIEQRFYDAVKTKDQALMETVKASATELTNEYDNFDRFDDLIFLKEKQLRQAFVFCQAILQDPARNEELINEFGEFSLSRIATVSALTGSRMQASIALDAIVGKRVTITMLALRMLEVLDLDAVLELFDELKLDPELESEIHRKVISSLRSSDAIKFLTYLETIVARIKDYEYQDNKRQSPLTTCEFAFLHQEKFGVQLDEAQLQRLIKLMPESRFPIRLLASYNAFTGDPRKCLQVVKDEVELASELDAGFKLGERVFIHRLCEAGYQEELIRMFKQLENRRGRTTCLSSVCFFLAEQNAFPDAINLIEQVETLSDRATLFHTLARDVSKLSGNKR